MVKWLRLTDCTTERIRISIPYNEGWVIELLMGWVRPYRGPYPQFIWSEITGTAYKPCSYSFNHQHNATYITHSSTRKFIATPMLANFLNPEIFSHFHCCLSLKFIWLTISSPTVLEQTVCVSYLARWRWNLPNDVVPEHWQCHSSLLHGHSDRVKGDIGRILTCFLYSSQVSFTSSFIRGTPWPSLIILAQWCRDSPRSVLVLVAPLVHHLQWRASLSLEMALWTAVADANMCQLAPLGSHHHAIMFLIPDKDAGRQLGY